GAARRVRVGDGDVIGECAAGIGGATDRPAGRDGESGQGGQIAGREGVGAAGAAATGHGDRRNGYALNGIDDHAGGCRKWSNGDEIGRAWCGVRVYVWEGDVIGEGAA